MKTVTININGKDVQIELTPEQLKQIETKKTVKWKPAYKEEYFIIRGDGSVACVNCGNDYVDDAFYTIGNCFKTIEEAQLVRDKRIAKQKLIDRIAELNEGWEVDFRKHTEKGCFQLHGNILTIGVWFGIQLLPKEYYFKSRKIGEQLIQEFGEETIINALFKL